jgi:hypothetical protein
VEVPTVPPPPVVAPTGRFRAVHQLSVALTWLLAIEAVVCVGVALASWHRHGLLQRVQRGDLPDPARMERADDYVRAAAGFNAFASLAILVLLIVFLWRATKNTELWERDRPKWKAGWTIGGWFIPFANFVIPVRVVLEIWRRSPTIDEHGFRHREPATAVGWWWATWVTGLVLVRLAGSWTGSSATVDELATADVLLVLSAVSYLAAALLLIVVVRRLAAHQAALSRIPLVPPPTPTAAPPGQWPHPV